MVTELQSRASGCNYYSVIAVEERKRAIGRAVNWSFKRPLRVKQKRDPFPKIMFHKQNSKPLKQNVAFKS